MAVSQGPKNIRTKKQTATKKEKDKNLGVRVKMFRELPYRTHLASVPHKEDGVRPGGAAMIHF